MAPIGQPVAPGAITGTSLVERYVCAVESDLGALRPSEGDEPSRSVEGANHDRWLPAGGTGPRGRTAGGPGVCRCAHSRRRRRASCDRAPERRGPGGRDPPGAPGAGPRDPGTRGGGEIGGLHRLDRVEGATTATIVVRR